MRGYAKISPQFWIGDTGRNLRAAGQEAMLVALYLLTNPHANMLGLYYLPKLSIEHETGLGRGGASKGLRRAIEAGFCAYDESSEMVFIHEMARYQIADQLVTTDKQCAGIQREYDGLPNNPFLAAFYEKYAKAFHLKNRRENRRPSEGASMPHRSQEQEQEHEHDKNPSSEQKGCSDVVTLPSKKRKSKPSREATAKPTEYQLDQLYRLYPRLVGKGKAKTAICKAVSVVMNGDPDHPALPIDEALDYLAQRVTLYAKCVQGDDPKYTPHPASWFNGERFWDDEREWGNKQNRKSSAPVPLPADYVSPSEGILRERAAAVAQ